MTDGGQLRERYTRYAGAILKRGIHAGTIDGGQLRERYARYAGAICKRGIHAVLTDGGQLRERYTRYAGATLKRGIHAGTIDGGQLRERYARYAGAICKRGIHAVLTDGGQLRERYTRYAGATLKRGIHAGTIDGGQLRERYARYAAATLKRGIHAGITDTGQVGEFNILRWRKTTIHKFTRQCKISKTRYPDKIQRVCYCRSGNSTGVIDRAQDIAYRKPKLRTTATTACCYALNAGRKIIGILRLWHCCALGLRRCICVCNIGFNTIYLVCNTHITPPPMLFLLFRFVFEFVDLPNFRSHNLPLAQHFQTRQLLKLSPRFLHPVQFLPSHSKTRQLAAMPIEHSFLL